MEQQKSLLSLTEPQAGRTPGIKLSKMGGSDTPFAKRAAGPSSPVVGSLSDHSSVGQTSFIVVWSGFKVSQEQNLSQ